MRKRPFTSRTRYSTLLIAFLLPIYLFLQLNTALSVSAKTGARQGQDSNSIPISRWPDMTLEGEAGTWGDLNNDGWLDLVVRRDNQMVLLFNQGKNADGTLNFAEVVLEQPVFFFVQDLDFVDINGDGHLDFSVADGGDFNQDYVTFFFINPGENVMDAKNWQVETLPVPAGIFATSMAWADINNDGKLDVAIANDTGNDENNGGARNQLFINESTTDTFKLTPVLPEIFENEFQSNEVIWLDIDQDGLLEMIFSQGYRSGLGTRIDQPPIEICWNFSDPDFGLGFFCEPYGYGEQVSEDFAWANIDGDNDFEVLIGTKFYDFQEYNLVSTEFELPTPRLYDVEWGDVDNDGDLDLLTGSTVNEPARIYVNWDGTFDINNYWETADTTSTNFIRLADIDNDGDLDLTLTAPNGTRIYLNHGGMPHSPQQTINMNLEPYPTAMSMAWGDVNGDGALDLAVGNAVFCDVSLDINTYLEGQTVHCISGFMARQRPNEWWPHPNALYINNNGTLELDSSWEGESATTTSVAWGDLNGDGLLDLVVGNRPSANMQTGGQNEIYFHQANPNGGLDNNSVKFGQDDALTLKIALVDVEGDGDLDVAVANYNQPDVLYLNDGQGNLQADMSWQPENTNSLDLAWGDIDVDGALDLAVVDENDLISIYRNEGDGLGSQPMQRIYYSDAQSLAWGDMDGDGDSDLAIGGRVNGVLLNHLGRLIPSPIWQSADSDRKLTQIAWGDLNGDGFLDLVAANHDVSFSSVGKVNRFYLNNNGLLNRIPSWQTGAKSNTASVALGDVNNDGLLDIAYGNGRRWWTRIGYGNAQHVEIYENQYPAVGNQEQQLTISIEQPNAAYFYANPEILSSGLIEMPYRLNHPDQINVREIKAAYSLNGGGQWFPAVATTDTLTGNIKADGTQQIYQWDVFTSGLFGQSDNVVFRIQAIPDLTPAPDGSAEASLFGTVSAQSAPMRVRGTQVQVFDESISAGNEVANAVTYVLQEGQSKAQLMGTSLPFVTNQEGFLNGRGNLKSGDQLLAMLPVTQTYRVPPQLIFNGQRSYAEVPMLSNVMTDSFTLEFWTFPTALSGTLFTMQEELKVEYATIADNTTLKFTVLGETLEEDVELIDGGAHHLAFSWQSEDGVASIYLDGELITTDQLAQDEIILGDSIRIAEGYKGSLDEIRLWNTVRTNEQISQTLFTTDPTFASSGLNLITAFPEEKDNLIGYWPIEQLDEQVATDYSNNQNDLLLHHDVYVGFKPLATIYHTSGPVTDSVGFDPIRNQGVQKLVVSKDNPLILYDIDVSLEWDARNDTLFLQQLEDSFKQASAILYDVTDGQMALGQVNLFHDKAYWGTADIMINADNSLRPSAAIGGVVNAAINDPDVPAGNGTSAYYPGQIRMGTSWDPYGENVADLGVGWIRALAHELAHYFLFLPDNYLGIDENGIFRRVVCNDSFMTTTSDPSFSEFLTRPDWHGACLNTIAQKTTARSDWETIRTFYPMLNSPTRLNEGPVNLPLDVTYLVPWAYAEEEIPYAVRNFDIRDVEKERLRLPNGQAILVKTNDPDDVTDDVLIDLGSPTGGGDRIKVRGAEDGDRVCLFASFTEQAYSGCIQDLNVNTVALTAAPVDEKYPKWNPQIRANSDTAVSVQVNVEQELLPGEEIMVQIYPLHYGSVPGNAPVATMNRSGNDHSQTLTMGMPAYDVAIRIWVEDDTCPTGLLPDGTSCIRESLTILRLNPEDWANPQTDFNVDDGEQPLPVLSYTPFGNPNTTAIGGPNTTAIGGPNTTAIGGPNTTAIGGPNTTAIGGPNTTAIGGPNTTAIGGPNTTAIGGPNTTAIGGAGRALLGNPNTTAIGGPNTTAIGGPNTTAIGGAIFLGNPNTTAIGGPNTTAIGGPNTTAIGGPNTTAIGGAGNILLGGPNTTAIGGAVFLGNPNTTAIGGPNTTAIGGGSKAASAPILSADSQLVIYDKQNFFAENGVKTVQTLFEVPETASHPWLVPVGQAYRVELEDREQERFISLNYLQRGVPEGYEHTLAAYFLPDGETEWLRINDSKSFVENLIVADLRSEDGVYAVMASIEMPTMKQGWNLFTYPLPVTRTVTESLASIAGNYSAVYLPSVDVETAVITQATVTAHSLFIRPQPNTPGNSPNYLRRGESVTVLGRDPVTGAYQIRCPQFIDTGSDECWITNSPSYIALQQTAVNIAPGLLPPTILQTNVDEFGFGNAYWIWIDSDTEDADTTIYLAPPRRAPNGELQ